MKINANKMSLYIVIFLVCISLTSVMLMQFKTVEETDIADLENLRETELRTLISEWKTKYEETTAKLEETNDMIEEYNQKLESEEESSELIANELKQSNMYVGKTDVYGEGVVITLKDTDEKDIIASDLLKLVNELRYAGAEAISINDARVISITEIFDLMDYSYIKVGEQRIESPYVVKAIGNQTYLSSILNLKDSGFVDQYKNSGKSVEMETSDRIEILKYNGQIPYSNLNDDIE